MGVSFKKKGYFHLSNGVLYLSFAMKFQRRHWLEDFALRVERVTQNSGYLGVCFLSVLSLLFGSVVASC
jgi:hypothetical protein